MSDIIIRDLATHEEYAAAENIQRHTWGMPDLEVIPGHALHAMQHSGAALLGAFDGPQLVGFTFGVLGTQHTPNRVDQVAAARLKMYSVIAGVLPEYQHQNVGFRLKMAQRDFCLRIGVRLITWTYDPLESRNGRFNIGKLGAVCHNYLRHFHGDMSCPRISRLSSGRTLPWPNAGAPTPATSSRACSTPASSSLTSSLTRIRTGKGAATTF